MLTEAQLIERQNGIGGSDAKKIVSGAWHELWLDKTGRQTPKAILTPWDVSVRHALEPLVMDDYAEQNNRPVTRRGDLVISDKAKILRCTLDGFDAEMGPVDAKALNIWTPDPEQWCVDNYTYQMQHQMFCTNSSKCALHVSLGMKKPFSIFFDRDDFFLAEYIAKCAEFWGYVERDEPPPGGEALAVEPLQPEDLRVVDMAGDNAWSAAAADWLANKAQAKTFVDAVGSLKAKMADDMRAAFGAGVRVSRSRAGRISIKADKEK